jgi:hypothetical protein
LLIIKKLNTFKSLAILSLLLFVVATTKAQYVKGPYDTILLSARVLGADTLPFRYLNNVYCSVKSPTWVKYKNANDDAYRILRYNVYKTYPYAIKAAAVLNEVDSVLASMYSKDAKKAFKDRKEAELNAKFNKELTNLSMDQGKILVKLVSRQTGKSVFDIVKSLKGGFNARLFQGIAVLWDNNLRATYNPAGEDAAIESIVQEIEARNRKR